MSQKNQALVNQFEKELADIQISIGYITKEHELKKNFTGSVLVKCSPGGASGGNCYGGRSSDYYNSDSQQESELKSEISYQLRELCQLLNIDKKSFEDACQESASNLIGGYSYLDERSDSSDYYGNYTSYRVYQVDILKFFKPLINETNQREFEVLQGYIANYSQQQDIIFKENVRISEINTLNEKIKNFDKEKNTQLTRLKTDIKDTNNRLTQLMKNLDDFEKNSEKERHSLEKKLKDLQEPCEDTVKTSKKKIK